MKARISNSNVSYIDALAPNGEVTFIADRHRYLGIRGINPIDIGPYDGKSIWLEGKWYIYIGGTLYQVELSAIDIDNTPPALTIIATPETLWPPNGRLVPVTIVATITDAGSGVDPSTTAYAVEDEYGSVEPSGSLTLGQDGRYTATIGLEASRRGNDADGRRYTITVSAQDNAGNERVDTAIVTVPQNQGQGQSIAITVPQNQGQGQSIAVTVPQNQGQGQGIIVTVPQNQGQGQGIIVTVPQNQGQGQGIAAR